MKNLLTTLFKREVVFAFSVAILFRAEGVAAGNVPENELSPDTSSKPPSQFKPMERFIQSPHHGRRGKTIRGQPPQVVPGGAGEPDITAPVK